MADGIVLDLLGMESVVRGIENYGTSFQTGVKRAIRTAGKDCLGMSQDIVPVGKDVIGTGFVAKGVQKAWVEHPAGSLKGSGKLTQVDEFTVEVSYGGESTTGAYVDYQWYVELGTHKMNAQPYLYPSYVFALKWLALELLRLETVAAQKAALTTS